MAVRFAMIYCALIIGCKSYIKPSAKPPQPSKSGIGYTYQTRPKYHVDLNWEILRPDSAADPRTFICYKKLCYELEKSATLNYNPMQFPTSGEMILTFTLDSNRKLGCKGIKQGLSRPSDSIFLQLANSVQMTGFWENIEFDLPFYINTSARRSIGGDTLDVNFVSAGSESDSSQSEIESEPICDVWRRCAFPGGNKQFERFLYERFSIPAGVMRKRESACVWVYFVIDQSGKLSNVSLKSGQNINVSDSLWFAEVKRVLLSSPRWDPARNNGLNVKCWRGLQIACYKEK